MDQLTDEERALAWKAAWHPSFAGVAIIDKDFKFRSVNPQFCELLGVTPAELLDKSFLDVTSPEMQRLDQLNAQKVIDGLIDFYVLRKTYLFSGDRKVSVVLLVTRVPLSSEGKFKFFVSRIMLDEDKEVEQESDINTQMMDKSNSNTNYPKSIEMVMDFWIKYGKHLITIGTALGAATYAYFNGGVQK